MSADLPPRLSTRRVLNNDVCHEPSPTGDEVGLSGSRLNCSAHSSSHRESNRFSKSTAHAICLSGPGKGCAMPKMTAREPIAGRYELRSMPSTRSTRTSGRAVAPAQKSGAVGYDSSLVTGIEPGRSRWPDSAEPAVPDERV